MHYAAPHYYGRFQCIAQKCPDTCCAGWQIEIDKESLKKYKRKKGPLGNRLHNEIDWKEKVFRQYEGRCAFLNHENLCDLYIEGGSKMFCRTCRTYPRHIEEYEGLKEFSLSLSCPVAANLILTLSEPVRFLEKEAEYEKSRDEDYEDFDYLLFTRLMDARDVMIGILQKRTVEMEVRMSMVLALSHDLQKRIDKNALFEIDSLLDRYQDEGAVNWFAKRINAFSRDKEKIIKQRELLECTFGILKGLEVLTDDWKDYLGEIKNTLFHSDIQAETMFRTELMKKFDIAWEQLMVYFVYTYFCGAVYDGNAYARMKFSVAGTLIIRGMTRALWIQRERQPDDEQALFEDLTEAGRRYAREIEHSDENKYTVLKHLDKEEIFTLGTFFRML